MPNYRLRIGTGSLSSWAERSQEEGVVWSHDFTDTAEFTVFDTAPASPTEPYYVKATSRVASGGPGNKPFLRLTHPESGPFLIVSDMEWVSSSAVDGVRVTTATAHNLVDEDYVQFVNLPTTVGTNTAKWSYFNIHGAGFGSSQATQILAIEDSTTFVVAPVDDLQGTVPSDYPTFSANTGSAVHRCRIPQGTWNRPMAAFTAGSNGKSTDDQAASNTVTKRTWDTGSSFRYYALDNAGFYGNVYHHTNQTLGVETGSTIEESDWDGTEFYLQFRVRKSTSRFERGQPAGKLVFFEYLTTNSGGELIITSNGKYPTPAYSNTWQTDAAGSNEAVTTPWYMYYGKPTSVSLAEENPLASGVTPPLHIMPGSVYEDTCLLNTATEDVNACWWWPTDEWVTVLVKFTPGKNSGSNYFGRTGNAGPTEDPTTGLTIWVAAPSQDYQKIFERTDIAWSWDQSGGTNYGAVPGFNCLTFSAYMNLVAGTSEFTHDFAEIIFSKNYIPAPSN